MKFDKAVLYENPSRIIKFHYITIITGSLHVDQYTVLFISLLVLLRMRKFSDMVIEILKTTIKI